MDHAINSGRVLLSLTEHHLREMGVAKVGHRLELLGCLEELRMKAGLVALEGIVDLGKLVQQ